jgi:AmmeMemoRadiSam system protein A
VTLHTKGGDLRGCIGNIGAFEPLIDNIRGNAFNAAFRDPRFRPVSSEEELKGLEFEISVLTEAEPIDGPDSFVIGEHGIILQKNGRSAVFLPQVAPEQGWDVPETLTHLSMKAGLGPDAWREKDTRFSVFRAVVFAERDFA